MLVSSVPLSLTIICGLPHWPMMIVSSRATLAPESDVSATSARHSLLKSSTMHRMRKRLPQMKLSETKSSDQRWFGPCGIAIGARVPSARLRPLRRRIRKPSSR
jgi:hypothetical protein